MRVHYTDERLAQLLAHAQDGKLAYNSCCCFVGIAFWPGDHPFALNMERMGHINPTHESDGKAASGGQKAEDAYNSLWVPGRFEEDMDAKRRRILIPMIRAEMRRRERLKKSEVIAHSIIQEAVNA